jgi:tripartite-type tricarboxylate transporter receptor subunit TctC
MTSRIFLALVTALFALGAPWGLHAQDYPDRPVTLVVPWPAGGTTDIGMRALASATEKYLKQKIVIENRPGNSPFGIAGPKGIDPAVVKIVHDTFKKGAEDPGYLEATAKLDQEAAYMSTDDYRRYVAAQLIEQKS